MKLAIKGVASQISGPRRLGIKGKGWTPFYHSLRVDDGHDICDCQNADLSYEHPLRFDFREDGDKDMAFSAIVYDMQDGSGIIRNYLAADNGIEIGLGKKG